MEDHKLSFFEMEKISIISGKCLADWAKKCPQIMQSATLSSPRLPGGGRKPPFPELEQHFCSFVNEKKGKKLMVNKQMLKSKALEFIKKKS